MEQKGLRFQFSIREGDKPLLEGSGTLGDAAIIMGRYWKSTFFCYLFALLSMDYELAICTSQILSPNSIARLGNASRMPEDGKWRHQPQHHGRRLTSSTRAPSSR